MVLSGAVHVTAAVLALAAAIVLARSKGTRAHVRTGWAYVGLLAVVSLLTLAAGIALSPRRVGARRPHAAFIVWSVAGLVAAGLAQATTSWFANAAPWPTLASSATVCAVAAVVTWSLGRAPAGGVPAERK